MTSQDFETQVQSFPDEPGVYYFVAPDKEILYIGRATSLRDRLKSYFKDDLLHARGALLVDIVTRASVIEWTKTDSVLEAIILEANLIKKYQPHGNTDEKDDKSFNYALITAEDFPRIILVRGKDFFERFPQSEIKYVFGPYTNSHSLKEGLKIIRKIFPFRDSCTPYEMKLNKRGEFLVPRPCFNRQIGLCPGVCSGEISKREYAGVIQNIRLLFEGKKTKLVRKLEKEMYSFAKHQEFEKANEIKRKLFSITHIRDVSVIKEDLPEHDKKASPPTASADRRVVSPRPPYPRIEGYDISHIQGSNTAGVMVVLEGRHMKKSDYRLFRIRRKGINDIGALKETITRRLNHSEWPSPDVIVVDGSDAQKRVAESTLARCAIKADVVAVVKNERHKPEAVLGNEQLISEFKREILLVNSEAHRFAVKYHRKLRQKNSLPR